MTFLFPVLLISAFAAVDAQWIFPGEDNGIKKQSTTTTPLPTTTTKPIPNVETTTRKNEVEKNIFDEATQWINEVLSSNETDLNNRFTINVSKTPSTFCTTTEGKEGKCVKPQYCVKEQTEKDPTTLFTYRESTCSSLLQCCDLGQVKQVPKKTNVLPAGCGWTNPGGYRLRTTGSEPPGFSNFADFPWMIALLKKSHNVAWSEEDYIGGGTLIHPSVVLTVAHKVDSLLPDQLKCRAGEWNTKAEDEIFIHQDRNVKTIAIHDEFMRLRAHYDAALLFLESPFQLENVYHIGTACLARDMPAPGTLCYSMGWGSSFNDTNNASYLKKIQLPMVDPATCQRQLRNTHLGSNYLLHHTLCCAGGEEGKDTCIGDGGSSLVCPVPSNNILQKYAVYGMVAYGVTCGAKDVPGVYAKVPTMTDWIDRRMQQEGLPTKSYYI